MRALIVSSNMKIGGNVREILLREGYECLLTEPDSKDFGQVDRGDSLADLLIVVLSPAAAPALDSLCQLRSRIKGPVLAVGLALDPKLILQALREGAA